MIQVLKQEKRKVEKKQLEGYPNTWWLTIYVLKNLLLEPFHYCYSGNPRRFHSQDVVRMEAQARTRSRPIDGPLEEIETEGQRQLQAVLHKQLDTNVSIQQYVHVLSASSWYHLVLCVHYMVIHFPYCGITWSQKVL